jgi:hypothetical protein
MGIASRGDRFHVPSVDHKKPERRPGFFSARVLSVCGHLQIPHERPRRPPSDRGSAETGRRGPGPFAGAPCQGAGNDRAPDSERISCLRHAFAAERRFNVKVEPDGRFNVKFRFIVKVRDSQ